ncbi:MAG: isoprenylcysteine carboxylmethyltransferase family protein [Anaerolineales bacterium]
MKDTPIFPQILILLFIFIILVPVSPLLVTQRWGWWEAWVYALIHILGFAVSRALAARQHPDLLKERANFLRQEDAEAWDKILSPLVGFGGGLIPLVAGLDVRFGWSTTVSMSVKLLALILILFGYALGSYALIVNPFFSGKVRIQMDRGHQVVTRGPYRWVRHPGYAGALLTYLAAPIFLDALWSFVPAAFVIVGTLIRTQLEDRSLEDRLSGYREYKSQVRHRLIPGIW